MLKNGLLKKRRPSIQLNCADPRQKGTIEKIEEASLYEKYTKREDFANQI